MPLSGAFRVYFLKHFSIGADVGYAFFFNSSLNNNIYYRPVLSANITKNIGIQASFSGVSDIFMFVTGGIVFTI